MKYEGERRLNVTLGAKEKQRFLFIKLANMNKPHVQVIESNIQWTIIKKRFRITLMMLNNIKTQQVTV